MKVNQIKPKVEKKVSKCKAKIASKCVKAAKVIAVAALFVLTGCVISGCATSQADSPTAQRAQSCTVKDVAMTFNIGSQKVEAASPIPGAITFNMEFGTAAQSNEAGGNETMTASPSATQTPTNDVKPQTDLTYGLSSATPAGAAWVNSLDEGCAKLLSSWLGDSKANGTVEVTKKDGTKETVTCKDGVCTTASGECITCERQSGGQCSDCSL